MKQVLALGILLLAQLATGNAADQAGIRFVLPQAGIPKIADGLKPFLESFLVGFDIPDQTFEKLDFTINVTHIKISSLNIEHLNVNMNTPNVLTASVSQVAGTGSADFIARANFWPHFTTSGTIDVSLTNGQLSSSVAALVDNQRPFLGNNGTKVQFDVSIRVHGSLLSWLYDAFIGLFKGRILNAVYNVIQEKVSTELSTLVNPTLQSMPVSTIIGHSECSAMTAHMLLPSGRALSDQFATTLGLGLTDVGVDSYSGYGNFLAVGDEAKVLDSPTCPTVYPALPVVIQSLLDRQLQALISEGPLNCLLRHVYSSGGLSVIIDSEDPHGFPVSLNTTDWWFLPPLRKALPNQAIFLDIGPASVPAITISSSGLSGTADFSVDVNTKDAAGNTHKAFALLATGSFAVDVSVSSPATVLGLNTTHAASRGMDVHRMKELASRRYSGSESVLYNSKQTPDMATDTTVPVVYFNVTQLQLSISVESSSIGSLTAYSALFQDFLEPYLTKTINFIFGDGIPLPALAGLTLSNIDLSFYDHYLAVATDISYVPPFMPPQQAIDQQ